MRMDLGIGTWFCKRKLDDLFGLVVCGKPASILE